MSDPNTPQDPLRRIDLFARKSPNQGASLTGDDLQGLKRRADAAAQSQTKEEEKEEEKKEDIPPQRLEDAEVADVTELQLMSQMRAFETEQTARDLEDVKRTLTRNKQIESRLKPISLGDYLLRGYVEQEVPVTPEYIPCYRTVDAHVELDSTEAAKTLQKQWPEQAKDREVYNYLCKITYLCCGLVSLSGASFHAKLLHGVEARDVRIAEIVKISIDLMKRDATLLNDLFLHQGMFSARVRKMINHAGYVEQELGKS